MQSQSDTLSLFPLNLVLFPGSYIPLHIYEERYKDLIQRCIRDRAYFGVNLVEGTEMSTVGCTAFIVEVIRSYEDGRLDIVIVGGRRYTVRSVDEDSTACVQAEVEYFDDTENAEVDLALYEECAEMYNTIIDSIFQGTPELPFKLQSPKAAPSFVMAQKTGLKLAQKQRVLEARTENARLMLLRDHMKTVMPDLHTMKQVSTLIQCDGYFPTPR